jgi:hypothetical protein
MPPVVFKVVQDTDPENFILKVTDAQTEGFGTMEGFDAYVDVRNVTNYVAVMKS